MALSNNDVKILEEIVSKNGDCMDSKRCPKCPFRAMCLPEFIRENNQPTQDQRKMMALDVLTHNALVDDNIDLKEYKWDKR